MLGSGIGMAAGAITSGAIDRALETQKAKKELDQAKEDDEKWYGNGVVADEQESQEEVSE